MKNKIIAVDFDGTLCVSAYPEIGEPRNMVIRYVLNEQDKGAKLILWTNRTGKHLEEAISWCESQGIRFDAVNENLPELVKAFGGGCRKVFANEYLDDRALTPEAAVQKMIGRESV